LDEARGLLYISNFTANRIEVMSLADNTVRTSMNVASQPGGLALSPDGRFLVVTNYANWGAGTPPASANLVTVIDLVSKGRQTFSTGEPPLAAAFVNTTSPSSGLALIATTTGFYLLDPLSGALTTINSVANVAKELAVPQATFPSEILQTAMGASADGTQIWGIADAGSGTQLIYNYDGRTGRMSGQVWNTTPTLLPRVSVSADGTWAMIGWAVFTRAQCGGGYMIRSRFPQAVESKVVTGHAADSRNNTIYAQIPDGTQPVGPPYSYTSAAANLPILSIMDADNLTNREKVYIPENITGRSVLSANAAAMYAISDSGVMVLPVGSMNKYRRLATSSEDLLVQSNFCNRNAMKQTFVLSDPAGNRTDFSIASDQPGVVISPSSGTTPATITVSVDPTAMQNTFGTLAVPLRITSANAVNVPPALRLLISNPDQDQRGSIINVPGLLSDILPDPARNRFYVVRQDKNQVLVFDGTSNKQSAVLRTGTTPTRISLSSDAKSLIVAGTNSQLLQVYDLDSLQPQMPVQLPPGHYGRSVAQSNNATFVVVENNAAPPGSIDRVDMVTHCATSLPTLGIFKNTMPATSVLTATPGQSGILLAQPDGTVSLYDAQADAWVLSRKDLTALEGAYAAADAPGMPTASLPDSPTDVGTYIVGNNIFNPALVPIGTLDSSVGKTLGFSFTGQGQAGFRVSGSTASGPGVIQNMSALKVSPGSNIRPVRVSEAPVLSTTTTPFTRTVAPLPSLGNIVVLTTSGVTVLSGNYDAAVAPPSISSIGNAADGSRAVAPGGLVSIYGSNMSASSVATSQMPLPTALGQSCLVANGILVPLLFVSNTQVNAQLPSRLNGGVTMSIHTPGGVSDNFNFNVSSTAPSVFTSGSVGPETGLATIVRADNNQLVTPTNPLHTNDTMIIYLTGLGATSPSVDDGMPAPSSPLASAMSVPDVTLGGVPLGVQYAGLVPGYVGVYQINASVPFGVPQGMQIPLVVKQGGNSTSLNVRVVK
jgi:uncharacterized protein (TIGR03437 family)